MAGSLFILQRLHFNVSIASQIDSTMPLVTMCMIGCVGLTFQSLGYWLLFFRATAMQTFALGGCVGMWVPIFATNHNRWNVKYNQFEEFVRMKTDPRVFSYKTI